MEDKILIKSEQKGKIFLRNASLICWAIAIVVSLLLTIGKKVTYSRYSYYSGKTITYTYKIRGWNKIFDFGENFGYFLLFLIGSACLLLGIIFGIIYLINRKCELCITEQNVKGKTLFGKEVVLPIYMVSAYSTRKFMSTIAVATSSGLTKFTLIKNYIEIGEILAKKINERQVNTQTEAKPNTSTSNNMDDLLKLKSLLDSGIITQEEFDAKKKQLLGL